MCTVSNVDVARTALSVCDRCVCCARRQRALCAERERDDLRGRLTSTTQTLQQAEQMQSAPDMEQAMDILKRSSLEVELAAKEKEVGEGGE